MCIRDRVIATHHHEAVARLREAGLQDDTVIDVTFHNLKSELDQNGEVQFKYELQEGEAPSLAIEVAKKIGGPALASIFD